MSNSDQNLFPTGSEWRKWDLHIHSPSSILCNEYPRLTSGEPDWGAFIAALERVDVAVLGITDYFTIEGYKKLRAFREEGRLSNIHTILPNIEFRLDNLVRVRGSDRRLNFHVIFSDEVSPSDIEEHFLHDLTFFYQGSPQTPDESLKLKPSNLEALGKRLKEEHTEFRNAGSDLKLGANCAVVRHGDITEILTRDTRFKGKYILVLAEELASLIDWDGQDHVVRKGLLQKSDMVFSSNPNTRNWCLGIDPYQEGEDHFIKEFKSLKPCIHGSDAHRIDAIAKPCALRGSAGHTCTVDANECEFRHCWIKADPTFEGLKQIIYEPKDRVVIQPTDPTPVKSSFSLGRFVVEEKQINADLQIAGIDIPLNGGMVAVTGGKGAGKTALVDLIAACFFDRRHVKDPNSFVKRIASDSPAFRISLSFTGGEEFSKTVLEDKYVEESSNTYIAQSELEAYIGEESSLSEYINNLIFDSPQVRDTTLAYDYLGAERERVKLTERLKELNALIFSQEQVASTTSEEELTDNLKKLEGDKKDLDARIKALGETLSESARKTAEAQQKELSDWKEQRETAQLLSENLDDLGRFLEIDLVQANQISASHKRACKDTRY